MRIELAQASDDDELRALLRDNPVGGDIRIGFEREPSFFAAANLGVADSKTIIAREPNSGRIVSVGEVSIRSVFVDGAPVRGAYLSSWKVDRAWRGRPEILVDAFAFVETLQREELHADFFFSAIIEGNIPALRRLETPREGFPRFRRVDDLVTVILPTRSAQRDSLLVPADPEALAFRDARLRRFQFTSDWSAPELSSLQASGPDTPLCLRQNNKITACAAIWDQRDKRQSIVRGYSRFLGTVRAAYNFTTAFSHRPTLPNVGSPLELASVCGFALAKDDPETAVTFLDALRRSGCREAGVKLLGLTLSVRHPAIPAILKKLKPWSYRSRFYRVKLGDARISNAIDSDRLTQPEAALL